MSAMPKTLAALLAGATALTTLPALAAPDTLSPAAAPRPLYRYVPDGLIITPRSSIETPAMRGRAMHTQTRIFVPAGKVQPGASAPYGSYETPASLACVYGVTAASSGCNPQTLGTVSTLGSKVVAIVDAYDYPNAASDLATFSNEFGLPAANFQVIYATGAKPGVDSTGGWELEEALDLDMAHALAPNAKIILVEASSNSNAALLQAETVAANAVAAAGGGEVSNSWGGSESSGEASNESDFTKAGVVFFASAGDSNGSEFPSVLPNVVGVGGTTIKRDASGNYQTQTTWIDTGGGVSRYIARPSYQNSVSAVVGSKRGAPDIGADANPNSGAWVYDTNQYEGRVYDWLVVGGTSEASPLSAAIVNAAGNFYASSTDELTTIYANLGTPNFFDVKKGKCGNAASGKASAGYDLCTGVGAPVGLAGK